MRQVLCLPSILVPLGLLVVLSACARETAAEGAIPASPATPPAAAASPAGCIEEFVQEFADEAQDPPREIPAGLCYNDDPEGPPKFPAMRTTVKVEYQRGDYYVVQDSASWTFDEPDLQRGCMVARLHRSRVVERFEGGVRESAHIDDGDIKRSNVTGEQYGSRVALGSPITEEVAAPGLRISRESTAFGIDCILASQAGIVPGSACAFAQPRRCPSTRVLLPAEIRSMNTTGGTQVGRTTTLRTGAVTDKSSWALP